MESKLSEKNGHFIRQNPDHMTREKTAFLSSIKLLHSTEAQTKALIYAICVIPIKMNILLADDNPEVRSALRLLLEQEPVSASIMEVLDSQDLLNYVRKICPVAVLLDWELPGSRKSDLLNALRSHCPEMKVIALSSKYEACREALAAGVDAFISKSEPAELVLTTLYSLLPGLMMP